MDDVEKQLLEIEENLHKWFKEKWVRFGPDGKIRGQCAREKSSEGKPKCRPLKSAQAMGKKGRATAARRKRREDPNPDRSGKAKNVKTEETVMKNINENHMCPICGGELVSELLMNEKKDACYYKVKSRYKVWPSAYASGALVKCRKKGAKNWGTKSEQIERLEEQLYKDYNKKDIDNILDGIQYLLDVIGLEQTVGAFADGSNAVISLLRAALADEKDETKKHLLNAAISSVSIIPFGDIAKIIKLRVLRKPAVKMFQFAKKYLQAQKPDRSEFSLNEKWSEKYKRSIDCSHPKGFSQKAHCQGRKKNEETLMKEDQLKSLIREMVEEIYNEQNQMQDECWECYEAAMQEGTDEVYEECYRKTNWDMVPEGEEHTCEGDQFYEIYGDINADAKENLEEAEYRGRKVKLGKPMRGDVKKFKVFVRNPTTGKVKKVNFGDKKMRIKKSNPKRRKSFRARHNCANPGPRTKARYWSCRKW